MGAAIDAVGDVVGPIQRNPILLAGGVLAGVILTVGVAVSLIPLIGSIIQLVVIIPVAMAGMVAMTDAALEESTGLGEFTNGISEHATTMMGAYGILFIIQIVSAIFVGIVALTAGIGIFAAAAPAGGGDPGAAMEGIGTATAVGIVVLALIVLVLLTILGFIQTFLDVAVIVGGKGAVAAVTEAWQVLRQGPVSALGYAFTRLGVTLVAAIPTLALFAVAAALGGGAGPDSLSGVAAVVGLLGAVTIPLPFVASVTYHVSYYRHRRGGPAEEQPSTGHGQGPADGQDRRPAGTHRERERQQREGTDGSRGDPQTEGGTRDGSADESGFQFD